MELFIIFLIAIIGLIFSFLLLANDKCPNALIKSFVILQIASLCVFTLYILFLPNKYSYSLESTKKYEISTLTPESNSWSSKLTATLDNDINNSVIFREPGSSNYERDSLKCERGVYVNIICDKSIDKSYLKVENYEVTLDAKCRGLFDDGKTETRYKYTAYITTDDLSAASDIYSGIPIVDNSK